MLSLYCNPSVYYNPSVTLPRATSLCTREAFNERFA